MQPVAFSTFAFLLSSMYAMYSSQPEKYLEMGRNIGTKLSAAIISKNKQLKRFRLLTVKEAIFSIKDNLWPQMFNKPADEISQYVSEANKFMVIDNDFKLTKFVSGKKSDTDQLKESVGKIMCGIIEGYLLGMGFETSVLIHVDGKKTIFIITF